MNRSARTFFSLPSLRLDGDFDMEERFLSVEVLSSGVERVLRAIEARTTERYSVRKLLEQVPSSVRAGFRSTSPDTLGRQKPK